jgi:hypothetical protein
MTSMRFNGRHDTSHYGSAHPLEDTRVVADSLTDIHDSMVKCFLLSRGTAYTSDFGSPHS